MVKKEFLVLGLGKFGMSIAKTLSKMGCQVIAVDKNEEKIQDIAEEVTYAVSADVTDIDVLKNLGISNLDAAVIAISNDMEASIMATILVKELGVPTVLAKASNEVHKKILLKIGADTVVFPEIEMGTRVARNLVSGDFVDLIELSSNFSIIETYVRKAWIGMSIRSIGFREKYKINVIAVKEGNNIDVSPNPNEPLREQQMLILLGDNKSLKELDLFI